MTLLYKKLDISLPRPPLGATGERLFHYGAMKYYQIGNVEYLEQIKQQFIVEPTNVFLIECSAYLNPHIDRGQLSCVNFYVDPGEYDTIFWVANPGARKLLTTRFDEATKRYITSEKKYRKEDLTMVDSFNAKANDVYALDISKIHSVENGGGTRTMIQIQWGPEVTLSELLQNLKI